MINESLINGQSKELLREDFRKRHYVRPKQFDTRVESKSLEGRLCRTPKGQRENEPKERVNHRV